FRPVFITSGPDGALYIADMYRGLIQHGLYVTPYLRNQTLRRKLVTPINRGRIWRIASKNFEAPKRSSISQLSADSMIALLSHPNGWHRDIAQQLLVERNDERSVDPLKKVVLQNNNRVSAFHALWALEGMQRLDTAVLLHALKSDEPLLQATALRLLEPFVKKDKKLASLVSRRLLQNINEVSPKVILQAALSAHALESLSAI